MISTVHMCLDVRGALWNRTFDYFRNDDGSPATREQGFHFLCDQLALGRKFIPYGHCDNFDYQTGCRGHEEAPPPAPSEGAADA